jgi:hypothetical protein
MKRVLLATTALLFTATTFAQAPTAWQSRGIGGGGALFSPSINPANQGEVFVACDMSELFHSTNYGLSWDPVHFNQLQGGHDSYVNFTSTPGLLYAVDYTSINGNDMTRPMKSSDGGATWAPLSGDPYGGYPGYPEKMFVDYNNANRIVLADYGTIYFSNNGGTSFTQIHTALNNGAGNHIAGVFFDGNNIYIGTNDGLIYSTNGGANFTTMGTTGMAAGDVILSFSGAREGSTVRFVCVTAGIADVYAGLQGGFDYGIGTGAYTMDNANGAWSAKNGGLNVANDLVMFCGMANNDVDTMYLAGGSSIGNPIVMRATASTNWAHVFSSVGNVNVATGWCGQGGDRSWGYAEAPFGFQVCPTNSKRVVFSDFGFVHGTSNAGASWQQQYVNVADQNPSGANTPTQQYYEGIGLENTTNWQVMWTSAANVFAPFSDINGVMSADSGKSWKFIPNLTQNSVYRMVRDANTGIIYAATSSVHDMYQSTRIYDSHINGGTGAVYFSTNNGTSFTLLHNFAHPVMWVALDPSNANRMYAAVAHSSTNEGGIYVTNNLSAGASSTWIKMAKPPRSNGRAFNINVLSNGSLVVSFSARKPASSSNFTDSSGVYFYDINTATWYDRSHTGMRYWTKDVVVDPNDATESTWYAAVFSGWANVPAGTGGVYKTTNKGVSWTQISNSYRVNSVTINPASANELYFTTETDGLWYSSNAGSGTPTFSQVSSYPFRHPVRVFYNPYKQGEIWVSSFGNGMRVGNLNQTTAVSGPAGNRQLEVYPNPAADALFFRLKGATAESQVTLLDLTGKEVLKRSIAGSSALDVHELASGLYFYHLRCGGSSFSGKVVISH